MGYRAWAKVAADHGYYRFVKNEPNGDVTIAAEGDNVSLEMFLDECRQGADYATVTSVEVMKAN